MLNYMVCIMVRYLVSILIFCTLPAYSANLHKESEYQSLWCKENNGVTEYVLDDKARVDCLTDEYAIEFDFANKWAESIGQSLYYGLKTNKKAGIVLIIEDRNKVDRYIKRLDTVTNQYNIKYWLMYEDEYFNKENNTIPKTQ